MTFWPREMIASHGGFPYGGGGHAIITINPIGVWYRESFQYEE